MLLLKFSYSLCLLNIMCLNIMCIMGVYTFISLGVWWAFPLLDLCYLSNLRNLWPFLIIPVSLAPRLLGLYLYICFSAWWMGYCLSFRHLYIFLHSFFFLLLKLNIVNWTIFKFCLLFFFFKVSSHSPPSARIVSVCYYT